MGNSMNSSENQKKEKQTDQLFGEKLIKERMGKFQLNKSQMKEVIHNVSIIYGVVALGVTGLFVIQRKIPPLKTIVPLCIG
jgi:hypothetical protein